MGDLADTVVLHAWDFAMPPGEVVGTRLLVASEPSVDVMGCGFTRFYTVEEANIWRATFAG